jgi:DNA-binding NtrC family response regulator
MSAEVPVEATRIMVVEDEQLFAKAIATRLEKAGYECGVFTNLADAKRAVREREPNLMLLDMRLPDGSGLEFLQDLRQKQGVLAPVIVMTAYGEIDDAVTAMKLEASDYLKKPIDLDELLLNVQKVLGNQKLARRLQYSQAREANTSDGVEMVGEATAMRDVSEQIARISQWSASADAVPPTVLITGETGTGKDVAARRLHQQSSRVEKPFVHVDCASLPKDLIEAELFGHVKGAFTNAHSGRTGLIEAAEDGVVFLDEIGELQLDLQAKLLAVLERRTLRRVGSSQEHRIDAWFIAATNRDVEAMVAEGALRSDLYFRLNVLTLRLPALRERGDDIILLAKHFGRRVGRRYGFDVFTLTPEAEQALRVYDWPGNVRELGHVIERAVLLSGGHTIGAPNLMLPDASAASSEPPVPAVDGMTLDEAEYFLIARALEETGNNVSEAARHLGITRMAMRYRMKKHGLV